LLPPASRRPWAAFPEEENYMRIQLISHASTITECDGIQIWSDPWLIGKAFNNSWSLLPGPFFESGMFDTVNYIWISHEHPDHFNIPTLKSFPDFFKEKVTVLFQQKNSSKIFDALRNMGFKRFRYLPNRKFLELAPGVKVYCYQTHLIDSCLAVIHGSKIALNANDAELDTKDCRSILKDVGHVDVVLNQFSLAGYPGYQDRTRYLPKLASEKLIRLENNHRDLNASVTIPFASFIYFSCTDNKYLNQYLNKPADVFQYLENRNLNCCLLYPGDIYEVSQSSDSTTGLKRYHELFQSFNNLQYETPQTVSIEEIKRSYERFAKQIHERYPKTLLYFLKPLKFYIDDLGKTVEISVYSKRFREVSVPKNGVDIVVNSQPLDFSFKFPFGFETLSVSGRFTVINNYGYWKRLKRLSILNNAEIYLKPRCFLKKRNVRYIQERVLGGLFRQIIKKLQRNRLIQHN
jgi:UDP-MurNAc hydroxylase